MTSYRLTTALLLTASVAFAAGCDSSGSDSPADVAADLNGDQGGVTDPGTIDTPRPDGGQADTDTGPLDEGSPGLCDPPCPAGEVCVAANTCVADCGEGFDGAALAAGLADGVTIVRNICGGGAGAYAFEPLTADEVLELHALDGLPDSQLMLMQATYPASAEASLDELANVTIPGSVAAFEAFPGLYIAPDPSGELTAFGYTGPFDAQLLTAPGSVFFGEHELVAPGNYSVTSITSSQWLVTAHGAGAEAGGNGVYLVDVLQATGVVGVRYVVTGLGTASGSVAVSSNVVLVGGWADPWPSECDGVTVNDGTVSGSKVFAVTVAELHAAASSNTPVDAFCELSVVELPTDFRFIPGSRLLAQDYWSGVYLKVYPVDLTSGAPVLGVPQNIVESDVFTDGRGIPGSDDLLLRHAFGYLVVKP